MTCGIFPQAYDQGQQYNLSVKPNRCVVCGLEKGQFARKYIVPKEYREHFPTGMGRFSALQRPNLPPSFVLSEATFHNSYDILLLCIGCHQRSSIIDSVYREELGKLHDAPIHDEKRRARDHVSKIEITWKKVCLVIDLIPCPPFP